MRSSNIFVFSVKMISHVISALIILYLSFTTFAITRSTKTINSYAMPSSRDTKTQKQTQTERKTERHTQIKAQRKTKRTAHRPTVPAHRRNCPTQKQTQTQRSADRKLERDTKLKAERKIEGKSKRKAHRLKPEEKSKIFQFRRSWGR